MAGLTHPWAVRLPDEVQALLHRLVVSDRETGGFPILDPEQRPLARRWLERLLLATEERLAFLDELGRAYGGVIRLGRARRDWLIDEPQPIRPGPDPRFSHRDLPPHDELRAVVQRGIDVLSDERVAQLLLNPYALDELADLIDVHLPEAWSEPGRKLGAELMARFAGNLEQPAS